MKLSELIAAVGDKNVMIQNLDVSAYRMDWSVKKGTEITFGTEVPLTPNGTEKLGLVVWLPREVVNVLLAKTRNEQPA